MKTKILFYSILLSLVMGCASSQKVTYSYLNKEAIPEKPYEKLFVAVLTKDMEMKKTVENSFKSLIANNGNEAVVSHELFAPNFEAYSNISREEMLQRIIDAGCDGIITFTMLDVLEKDRYEPGIVGGMPFGYYGSFFGYYSHRFPTVYSPGYYTTDKTYLFETNIYDVQNESIVWSAQSKAYNPSDYDKWFKGYIKMLRQKMIEDGLIPSDSKK